MCRTEIRQIVSGSALLIAARTVGPWSRRGSGMPKCTNAKAKLDESGEFLIGIRIPRNVKVVAT